MNYTQNLHLPQWEASDRIHHDDFNDAMAKIDEAVKTVSDTAAAIQAVVPKIATGSYRGTGTHGSASPTSLTFDFPPKIVILHKQDGYVRAGVFFQGETTAYIPYVINDAVEMHVSWSNGGKTLSWYCDTGTEDHQMNHTTHRYRYYAIG